MVPSLEQRAIAAYATMPPADVEAVLRSARTLQNAARAGRTQPLLRGKNVGLITQAAEADDGVALFRRAAQDLGAQVAYIGSSLTDLGLGQDLRPTAHVLARLYDAIECQGLPPAVVRQLRDACDVPVFDGIGAPGGAASHIADRLEGDALPEDKRRYVLQALLLGSLA